MRLLLLDTPLKQSSKDYANAKFCSAQGSRTFALLLITPLKQSSKDYANAKFSSAEGSRTFGAFGSLVFSNFFQTQ
jgi:hypothetical protein